MVLQAPPSMDMGTIMGMVSSLKLLLVAAEEGTGEDAESCVVLPGQDFSSLQEEQHLSMLYSVTGRRTQGAIAALWLCVTMICRC